MGPLSPKASALDTVMAVTNQPSGPEECVIRSVICLRALLKAASAAGRSASAAPWTRSGRPPPLPPSGSRAALRAALRSTSQPGPARKAKRHRSPCSAANSDTSSERGCKAVTTSSNSAESSPFKTALTRPESFAFISRPDTRSSARRRCNSCTRASLLCRSL